MAKNDATYSVAQFARPLWQTLANPKSASCPFPAKAAAAPDDAGLSQLISLTVSTLNDADAADSKAVGDAKHSFMRTRPFACNRANQPQLACATGGLSGAQYHGDGNPDSLGLQQSYPSGHATFGFLVARLLAYMVPEQQTAIMARAAEYGWHRVVLNAHFPKDVKVGGTQSGNKIADLLLNDPASLKQLDGAKQELRKQLCY